MLHLLTAYQLELYDARRFLTFVYTHPRYWIRWGDRQELVWTMKARALFVLSIILILGIVLSVYFSMGLIAFLFSVVISVFLFPFILTIAHGILSPMDIILKRRIIAHVKQKLQSSRKNLTVIGITWSYGKTSQKEILETILAKKYHVLTTEGNKNTPLGVADTIEKRLTPEHQIFIVEMGAYTRGNIRELCELVSPDIALLTGITYQHLERFGSIEAIIATKFELPESISDSWLMILDTMNDFVREWFRERQNTLHGKIIEPAFPEQIEYTPDFGGIIFRYNGESFSTTLLADHSAHPIIMAYEVARYLGMESSDILAAIREIQPVEHRLQPIYNPTSNIWVIDDSYNGNIEWVRSTIRLLAHTVNHRRLYLTPGLVELGGKSHEIHFEIGTLLAPVIDRVLLIDSVATRSIHEGLRSVWYPEEHIIIYPDTQTAHASLWSVLESWDVIVFQNDWSDNYF